MKIVEKFLKGKNKDQSLCEDDYFFGKNYVLVVDGATSKNNIKYNNVSGGKMIATIVKNTIQYYDQFDSVNFEKIITIINKKIQSLYKKNNINIKDSNNLSAASFILYSNIERKIYTIGDCQALLINKNNNVELINNEKEIDILMSKLRSFIIHYLKEKEYFTIDELLLNDKGREMIVPFLKMQSFFQNNEIKYGYNVIDGQETKYDEYYINQDVSEIVLSSDGYPSLKRTLEDSENYLKLILEKDPLMYNLFLSTKGLSKNNNSFDDRTYLRFKL